MAVLRRRPSTGRRHPTLTGRPEGGQQTAHASCDDDVAHNESVEAHDDDERDERVNAGIDPRPDLGHERLVTVSSGAVCNVVIVHLRPTAPNKTHHRQRIRIYFVLGNRRWW